MTSDRSIRIFLSYRRGRTSSITGRLYDRLADALGDEAVFMDIDDIPVGADFHDHIANEVSRADVMLAVIGPDWVSDERDLHNEDDFIRLELETALDQGLHIVPVFTEGGGMPKRDAFPPSLVKIPRIHGLKLDAEQDFRRHVERLLTVLDRLGPRPLRDGKGIRAGTHRSSSASPPTRSPAASRYRRARTAVLAQPGEVFTERATGMRFLWVPGGTFEMGSESAINAQPPHRVRVSAFWLGETPVTNDQYRAFLEAGGTPPSYWSDRRYNRPDQPVVGVGWEDAMVYAGFFTSLLKDQVSAEATLPTEAQWERAARGEDGRTYPWGEDKPSEGRAWFGQDIEVGAKPVGQYPAGKGPYGHLDLAGNVWEWCRDAWDEAAYEKPPHGLHEPLDPEVTSADAHQRPVRGGSFRDDTGWLRAARRYWYHAGVWNANRGFRLVLSPRAPGGSGGSAP